MTKDFLVLYQKKKNIFVSNVIDNKTKNKGKRERVNEKKIITTTLKNRTTHKTTKHCKLIT